MRCFSPEITLTDSSIVVRGGTSRLLIVAALIGCSAALGFALASARRARKGRWRPTEERLGDLERLRGLELISEEECENRREQILEEI